MGTLYEILFPSLIGVLVVASPFLLLKIHSDYQKETGLSKLGLVFGCFLFTMFGVVIGMAPVYSRWVFAPNSLLFIILGYAIMLTGIIIMVEAFVEFRSFKRVFTLKTDKVISTGVYRFSRNPQYLGYILFLIGFSLPYRSILAFIFIVTHIIVVEVIFIQGEERYLEKKLGDEYMQYKKRVRRWL